MTSAPIRISPDIESGGDANSYRGQIIADAAKRIRTDNLIPESRRQQTAANLMIDAVPKLPPIKQPMTRPESFQAIQEWEGVITDVGDEKFRAMLIDVTANEKVATEFAELDLEDLQDDDRARVKKGAIFRWVIGYAKSTAGTKTRGSRIYFRRVSPRSMASPGKDLVFEDK